MRLSQRSLRADDPLRDRRGWDEEGPRDLFGRQSAKDPQGEGDPSVLGEDRMAGHEHEAEEVVADFLFDRVVHVDAISSQLEVASYLLLFSFERLAAADEVERAVLRGAHQPGSRLLGHAFGRPLLERGDEGVLGQLLGRADVADHARQPGDEPGRLDAPDRLDRAMCLGVGIYGKRSVTCPPCRGSAEPRRSPHRRARA